MNIPGTISQLVGGAIGVLPLDVARAKSVCRFCHNSTGPSPGNPIVLNYGQEYAHQHCIDRAKASGTFIPARASHPVASPAPQPLSAEDEQWLKCLRVELVRFSQGANCTSFTRVNAHHWIKVFDHLTADRFK